MYKRYLRLPVWGRIVVVMIVLLLAASVLQLVLGLARALIPVAVLAVAIVGLLWVFEKVRGT